ncbi:regulator [Thermoclostridium stercorarium subsp. stercorarium DSM 8532]|nr:regulator [Thermoclostridium stercorarium subsp. stercorarium DSM 8532]
MVLVAKIFGFERYEYFEASENVKQAPEVKF